jgi:RimJ/RimL family protein N-acetyltransferase
MHESEFYRRFEQITPVALYSKYERASKVSEIYFERVSMSGLEEMHRYSTDERLYEFFEFDPFDNIEKTRAYIDKLQKRMAGDLQNRTSMYWFVRRKSDNFLIGTAALTNLNYARKSIEWGYGVDPKLWEAVLYLKYKKASRVMFSKC